MNAARDRHGTPSSKPRRHHRSLSRRRRPVIHACVVYFHAGQLADHGWEFEDGLKRPLGNLGLVRGWGGTFSARLRRDTGGMGANKSSMERAPMAFNMASRSAGDFGR